MYIPYIYTLFLQKLFPSWNVCLFIVHVQGLHSYTNNVPSSPFRSNTRRRSPPSPLPSHYPSPSRSPMIPRDLQYKSYNLNWTSVHSTELYKNHLLTFQTTLQFLTKTNKTFVRFLIGKFGKFDYVLICCSPQKTGSCTVLLNFITFVH